MLKSLYLLLLTVLLFVSPTLAQDATPLPPTDATWTVSLYNQMDGTITRISPLGEVVGEFVLPLPDGFDTRSYEVVTSPLGNHIAYIASLLGDGSVMMKSGQIVVYDTSSDSIIATYNFNGEITGINAASSSLRFSADGTRLLSAYYVPTSDQGDFAMELVVLDVLAGEVVNVLTSEDLRSVLENPDTAYSVQTVSFKDGVATLLMRPVFVGMANTSAAVVNWNVTTNEVSAGDNQLLQVTDSVPATDEALFVIYDRAADELGEGETRVEGTQRVPNTVQLYDPTSGEAQTIFAQDAELASAKFVQNGERILVFAEFGSRGILIDRDGTALHEYTNLPGIPYTLATPEGFVYTDPTQQGTIIAVRTTDDHFVPRTFYQTDAVFTGFSVQDYQVIPPAVVG